MCKMEWPTEFDTNQNLSLALVEIINTLYVEEFHLSTINLYIKVKEENREYLPEFEKIIDKTMQLLNDNIAIRLKNNISISTDNERHHCVMFVDSWKSLE